jgi:hypothetical protein
MKDCNDEHTLLLNQVHEAIGANDELAILRQLAIGETMATVGEAPKGLGGVNRELRQASGIRVGVFGDELDRGLKIVDGGIGPDYRASHFARRFFTCS